MNLFATTTAILFRFFVRWRATFGNYLLLRVFEPVIFLYAMGFGLALAYQSVNGVPYLNYVIPGAMCANTLYAALIDGAYGTLTREKHQGLWHSQLATTITLRQILLTENLFTGFKASFSCFFVFIAALIIGGIDFPIMILPTFFILWFGGMALSALAQVTASGASNYDEVEYIWALLIAPMFLFSGVFIPIDSFPETLQTIIKLLPLYHMLEPTRNLMLDTATLQNILPHLAYLALFFTACHLIAHHRYKQRLFA